MYELYFSITNLSAFDVASVDARIVCIHSMVVIDNKFYKEPQNASVLLSYLN